MLSQQRYMEDRYKEIMKVYDIILSGTEDLDITIVVEKKSQAERKCGEGLFTLKSHVSNKTTQNSPPSSKSSIRKGIIQTKKDRFSQVHFQTRFPRHDCRTRLLLKETDVPHSQK